MRSFPASVFSAISEVSVSGFLNTHQADFNTKEPQMVRPALIDAVTNTIRRAYNRYRKSRVQDTERCGSAADLTIEMDWGVDLDSLTFRWTGWDGTAHEARVKGRCARCWGGLVARHDDRHQISGMKCRVCGEKLEGEAARDEDTRMRNEHAANRGNVSSGRLPRYADNATFVLKTFPAREHMSPDDLCARVTRSKAMPSKGNKIDRNGFPPGTPGYFVLQATTLMASVENIFHPHMQSVADFPRVRFRDDGSAIWTISTEGIGDDPQFHERRLLRNLGETLTAAMISAFACELAMKAVSLTVNDEALKKHDLKQLYDDLPEPSRRRVAADYPGIAAALDAGRQTFDSWRYFESSVGEAAARALIDTEQARNLGKAARVILDEAETVGLGYAVNLEGRQDVRASGAAGAHRQHLDIRLNINVTGREGPPSHDPVPAPYNPTYPFPLT